MGDVASHGRTIIFVSHNMQAVQSLCKTALYLKAGKVVDFGRTDKVINNYLSREVKNCLEQSWADEDAPGNDIIKLVSARITSNIKMDNEPITIDTDLDINVDFILLKEMELNLSLLFNTPGGLCIFNSVTDSVHLKPGKHTGRLKIPGKLLNDDIYTIRLLFVKDASSIVFGMEDLLTFEVADRPRTGNWFGKWEGAVRPNLEFTLI